MLRKVVFLFTLQLMSNICFSDFGDATTDVMPLNIYFPSIYGTSYNKTILISRDPSKLCKDMDSSSILDEELASCKKDLAEEATKLVEKKIEESKEEGEKNPSIGQNSYIEAISEEYNLLINPQKDNAKLLNNNTDNIYNQMRVLKNDAFSICQKRDQFLFSTLFRDYSRDHYFKVFVFYIKLVKSTVERIISQEKNNRQHEFKQMVKNLGDTQVNYIQGCVLGNGQKTNTILPWVSDGISMTIDKLIVYGHSDNNSDKSDKSVLNKYLWGRNTDFPQPKVYTTVSLADCDVGLAYLAAMSYSMVHLYDTGSSINQLNETQDLLMHRFFQKAFFNKLGMLGLKNYSKMTREFTSPVLTSDICNFCCSWCGYTDFIVNYPSVPMPTHDETCYFVIIKSVFTAGFQILSAGKTSRNLQDKMLNNIYELALNCAPKNVSEIVEKALDDFSSKIQENPSLLWTFMVYLDKLKNSNSDLYKSPPKEESVKIFIDWYSSEKGYSNTQDVFDEVRTVSLESDSISPLFGTTKAKDYTRVFGEKIEPMQEIFNEKERIKNRIESISKQLQSIENSSNDVADSSSKPEVKTKHNSNLDNQIPHHLKYTWGTQKAHQWLNKSSGATSSPHTCTITSSSHTGAMSSSHICHKTTQGSIIIDTIQHSKSLKAIEKELSAFMKDYNQSLENDCSVLDHKDFQQKLGAVNDRLSKLDITKLLEEQKIRNDIENEIKCGLKDAGNGCECLGKALANSNNEILINELINIQSTLVSISEATSTGNSLNLSDCRTQVNRVRKCINEFNAVLAKVPKAKVHESKRIISDNAENMKYTYFCPICLVDQLENKKVDNHTDYPEPKTMVRTLCKHIFCITCFETIAQQSWGNYISCPLCRGQVKTITANEIRDENNIDFDGVYQFKK